MLQDKLHKSVTKYVALKDTNCNNRFLTYITIFCFAPKFSSYLGQPKRFANHCTINGHKIADKTAAQDICIVANFT